MEVHAVTRRTDPPVRVTPVLMQLAYMGIIDSENAFVGFVFITFSMICLLAAALAYVRSIRKTNEKMFVVFLGLLVGPAMCIGSWAIVCVTGVNFAGVFYKIVLSFNSLTDQELNNAITKLFKSLPKILGPIVYLSGASLRCIVKTGGENVDGQCWNPHLPTIFDFVFRP